jgi:hypothetical protein
MSDQIARAPTSVLGNSGERTRGRSKYFLCVALVLLAFVLTGFGPTLFARPFFDVPPLPWYLFLHGFVLASWFLLLVAQTTLVVAHRTDLHRRLGVLGGFIAVALVVMSLVAVLGFPAHVKANILTSNVAFDATVVRTIVWTDFASLLIFSTFVAIALYWRRRSDVHKRLLLLASMATIGPRCRAHAAALVLRTRSAVGGRTRLGPHRIAVDSRAARPVCHTPCASSDHHWRHCQFRCDLRCIRDRQ